MGEEERRGEGRRQRSNSRSTQGVEEEGKSFNGGIYFRPISGIPRRWNLLGDSSLHNSSGNDETSERNDREDREEMGLRKGRRMADEAEDATARDTRGTPRLRQRSNVPTSQRGSSFSFPFFSFFFPPRLLSCRSFRLVFEAFRQFLLIFELICRSNQRYLSHTCHTCKLIHSSKASNSNIFSNFDDAGNILRKCHVTVMFFVFCVLSF